ncbi:DUF1419 domain-containing protein [Rhizobium wenxiniae]|uniref:DUF1419 domain-containing protein n=1 Tax=Rhizobium wenxiniae TaxID=1737357 RepID=UPI001C6F548A|nr:DUF1419 domain-containing protein [Rhizobium wenxiniae]MBW9089404.1 DUF1419 domain-containing protein [Rhizobium wenxiniae]
MTVTSIRKVFQGIADRRQMFRMFDRHIQRPNRWTGDDSALYRGEWFEIDEASHDYMFEILPPLFMRGDLFAMREYLIGSITSIFFKLSIDGTIRHFHGYCDLSEQGSLERMRGAIVERETRPVRAMTREERLEHIWSSTADDYRGYASDRWSEDDRGQRTIMLWSAGRGTILKLLADLTDDEVAAKLPVQLRHLPDVIAA